MHLVTDWEPLPIAFAHISSIIHQLVRPFFAACGAGDLTSLQHIIDGYPRHAKALLEASDKNSCSPLHVAARSGHLPTLIYLVEKGAAIDSQDLNDGKRPIHEAAEYGHVDTLQYLLERGANIEDRNKRMKTPLHVASLHGQVSIVEYLVGRGAALEAQDEDGFTPLHDATSMGHCSTISYLLDKGANIEARDKMQRPALHIAIADGHLESMRILVERGADIAAEGYLHLTAPNYARFKDRGELIEPLQVCSCLCIIACNRLAESEDRRCVVW